MSDVGQKPDLAAVIRRVTEAPDASSVQLSTRGRVALLAVVGAGLVADLLLHFISGDSPWRSTLAGMAITAMIGLFVWSPVVAASSLLAATLIFSASGTAGGYILYLALVTGLVVYTCQRWFAGVFIVASVGINVLAVTTTKDFTALAVPALAIVSLLSGVAGHGLRRARERHDELVRDIASLNEERAAVLSEERERIADELHNIIAHDVTLVAMHARVLERVDDPALRGQSIEAIRDAADQALSDIRRVLHVVRDSRPDTAPDPAEETPQTLAGAISDARADLIALGSTVELRLPREWEISTTVETTLIHVVREAATNAVKHTDPPRSVVVSLSVGADDVDLRVETSPARQRPAAQSSGYGLDRLRQRVTMLDGELFAGPSCTDTWMLRARLPKH